MHEEYKSLMHPRDVAKLPVTDNEMPERRQRDRLTQLENAAVEGYHSDVFLKNLPKTILCALCARVVLSFRCV